MHLEHLWLPDLTVGDAFSAWTTAAWALGLALLRRGLHYMSAGARETRSQAWRCQQWLCPP